MTSTAAASSGTSNKSSFSCVRCADRKVKCDRQIPCSACLRHNAQCVFRPPRPPRRRQKASVDHEVNEKLRHYESLLKDHGIGPSHVPENGRSPDEVVSGQLGPEKRPSIASQHSEMVPRARLLHDQERAKLVDNVLWTRVIEEHHNPGETLDDSANDETDSDTSDVDLGFVLGARSRHNTALQHPNAEDILSLWQIYTDNVDPILKIVHVPTLDNAVRKAAQENRGLAKSFEALLFAVYGAAVMTLKDDECQQKFGLPRKRLLARYIRATKDALTRAKFMGTSNIVVLQALAIHIVTLRDLSEPLPIWTLTGVALRIADSMGLNRNGESLGLPPFEAEIRRRIWWQLKMHDSRAAELSGMAKFKSMENEFNVNAPLNVDDAELFPNMVSLPAGRIGLTDITFAVIRSDLTRFATANAAVRGMRSNESMMFDHQPSENELKERDHAIDRLEESIESKYLRYCDPSRPAHLFMLLMTRFAMNIARFHMHHPRGWSHSLSVPDAERQKIWNISLKLLEQCDMMQTSPQLRRFAWNAPYYLPWYALIHVLDTLRSDPHTAEAPRAWQLVEASYNNNLDIVTNTRKAIHVAVGNLCLKAFAAYEKAMANASQGIPQLPKYIEDLRQQRIDAKAKRAARKEVLLMTNVKASAKAAKPDGSTDLPMSELTNYDENLDTAEARNSWAPGLKPSDIADDGIRTSFETSGLFRPFEGAVSDMDIDFMLDLSPGDQQIDWAQWDAWLKDVNANPTNAMAHMSTDFGFTDINDTMIVK